MKFNYRTLLKEANKIWPDKNVAMEIEYCLYNILDTYNRESSDLLKNIKDEQLDTILAISKPEGYFELRIDAVVYDYEEDRLTFYIYLIQYLNEKDEAQYIAKGEFED